MQEQLTAPSAGRERWADLQGSVSGMLEEMSGLVRRVDGLEEKLRLRTSGCEELVRQKARELEQQVHSLQQKALLASSTSEEMSKRHTTRLRKLGQAMEEHSQRLSSVEDLVRRPSPTHHADSVHLEARLVQLEHQLAGHEDDLRNLAQSAEVRSSETGVLSTDHRQGTACASRGAEDEDFDSMLRALEREVSGLSQRTSSQLDEHSVALANLRVRSDGQEQRLKAASERLETVVNPPLEALRAEVSQLRDHDRMEAKTQLDHLGKSIQAVLESSEESAAELRGKLTDLRGELQSLDPRVEDHPMMQKLVDTSSTQEQAIRRLEAMLVDTPRGGGAATEELCSALVRLDSMEHRLECIEQAGGEEELAEKADRSEVTRIDAALQELSEPLRRLSQRTASSENRTVALERRVEQLQQMQGSLSNSSQPQAHDRLEDLSAAAAGPSVDALADLTARVVEIESLLEHGRSLDAGTALASQADSDGVGMHSLRSHVADLAEQVAQIRSRAHDLPSSSGDKANQGSQTLQRLAASEDATRALQQQLHQLQSDHRKLESTAACGSGHEERISFLEKASREVQQHVQEVAARPQDSSQEHRLMGQEANLRVLQDDLQELRRQTRELSHSNAISADNEDRFLSLEREAQAVQKRLGGLEDDIKTVGPQLQQDLQALEARLRGEQADMARNAAPAHDHKLEGRVAEISKRVDDAEKHLSEVQNQLEAPIKRLDALAEVQAQAQTRQLAEAERVDDVLQRVAGSEKAVQALQAQQEESLVAARKHLDEPMQALREQLKKLQEGQAELEGSRPMGDDGGLAERVSEAVELASSGEKALKAFKEQHEEQLKEVRSKLTKLERGGDLDSGDRNDGYNTLCRRIHETEKSIGYLQTFHNNVLAMALHEQVDALKKRMDKAEASAGASKAVDDLVKRMGNAEDGMGGIRADVRVVEASLKDALAQLERLSTQAETAEVSRDGTKASGDSVELEQRIKEMQKQVSEELDSLLRHQKDLSQAAEKDKKQPVASSQPAGPAANEETERAVADLSRQVASELQDLLEHQQDLRKVKDLVSELSSKAPAAEQDKAGGVGSTSDADQKSISKLESTVEGLCKQVEALQAEGKNSEASGELKQQMEKLQSSQDELSSKRMQELEKRMEQLRSDQNELSNNKLLGGDFVDRVSEVMQRMKGGEEKIAAVEKQLEQPIKALDARLEQLRSDYEALKQTKVLHSDLTGRISEVLQRLSSSEEAIAALQRRPAPAGSSEVASGAAATTFLAGGGGAAASASVEAQVQDLRRKVTEELAALEEHQRRLAAAGPLPAGGGGGSGSEVPAAMEARIKELQEQVAQELQSLERHQKDLVAAGSAARGEGSTSPAISASVEAQIRALQQQVTEELHILEKQQGDLAMAGLSRRGSLAGGHSADVLPGATGGDDVEQAVAELSRQVASELQDLRDHQQDLGRVRTAVMALKSTAAAAPNGHAPSSADEIEGQKRLPQQLERQIEDLSKQVSSELQALAGQQAELGQAKATLGSLSKQVKDVTDGLAKCDSTCSSLKKQLLDEYRVSPSASGGSRSLPAVGISSKSVGSVSGAKASSSGKSRKRGGNEELDSDHSDTYGNEFEESIGEESISESR